MYIRDQSTVGGIVGSEVYKADEDGGQSPFVYAGIVPFLSSFYCVVWGGFRKAGESMASVWRFL